MIGRVLLAAILAGLAAGLVMGVMQHVRLTPLIQYAETFENAGHSHNHAAPAQQEGAAATPQQGTEQAVEPWMPADGLERTLLTTLTAMLTGAGYALIMAAVALFGNREISLRTGLFWGLCGFLAASFAPAVGLPPELPGMPAADVTSRQVWWFGTIVCTGLALWVLTSDRPWSNKAAAAVLLLAPHVIGAPQPASHESTVPAGLAAQFATASLGANLVFWCLIGLFLGLAWDRMQGVLRHA